MPEPSCKLRHCYALVFAFFYLGGAAQPDSLATRPCAYFEAQLSRDDVPPALANLYAKTWLVRARATSDGAQEAAAWKAMAYLSPAKARLQLADSMVAAAQRSKNAEVLAGALLTKGAFHYDAKQLGKALDCFVRADAQLTAGSDPYLRHKVRYQAASLKVYLGYYGQAIPLLRAAAAFYRDEGPVEAHMACLHALGVSYSRMGQMDESGRAIAQGLALARQKASKGAEARFLQAEGVRLALMGNYKTALPLLLSSLAGLRAAHDDANLMVAYHFIGLCHWERRERSEAVPWFCKVERLHRTLGYIKPETLDAYEKLVDYYRALGDRSKEVHFIDLVIASRRHLAEELRDLGMKLGTEFDNASLQREKQHALEEKDLANAHRRVLGYAAGAASSGLLLFAGYHIRQRRRYHQKYLEAMQATRARREPKPAAGLDINPDIVQQIRKQLGKFEAEKRFLDKDLKLEKLARRIGFNYKYVSRVIQHDKGRRAADYINDLRIEYVVGLLKEDGRMRHYSNPALAQECGFATTQHFVNAFKSRLGLPPSVFLEKMRREGK